MLEHAAPTRAASQRVEPELGWCFNGDRRAVATDPVRRKRFEPEAHADERITVFGVGESRS
jgi:hypothetical protein